MSEPAITRLPELTHEVCDGCPTAKALYHVKFADGLELTLCGHHTDKLRRTLSARD